MLLEGIGAFSLACNILQVVEYGAKIVGKAGALHRSNRGGTTEIDDLDAITHQLSKLNNDLSGSVASTPPLASPLQIRLAECNAECLRLSQKFIKFVQKLRPKNSASQGNPSWAEAFRSAIRLKWNQEEIEAMQKGLSQAKSNLIIAFLLYMHSTSASNSSLEAILTASSGSERNMLAAIADTSNKLHGDIAGLTQQMSNVKIDQSTCETLFANFQASHADALSRLVLGIETIMLEQEAIRITSDKERAEIAQKRICMSLSFRDMDSRQNQIREAHQDTYHWILSPQNTTITTNVCLGGFQTWLDSPAPVHRLFWMAGKPGSGKSTLMRYLDHNLNESCCTRWLSGHGLFVGRFFLWNPGRGLQKSFHGLLQAILHQLLFAHRWLIEAVVSEEKWSSACDINSELNWSISELKTVIEAFLHRISTTRKIVLLIDGLDELEGTDDDRDDMLNFLRKLADFERVKLCVSSRPWNIFSDYFHDFPQLSLQLFTRKDIDKYVRDSLSKSMHLQSSYLHNSGEGEKLIEAIIDKASGVFLWVRLVVQELLRGFRDGETIRTLRRKVHSMPADLDGFFRRIIDSIDPPYRREGSAFLQTALFSLQNDDVDWPRGLLEFTFLEAEEPDFVARPSYDFTELNYVDMDALEYRIDLGKRRLNSRCMGLLEWANTTVPVVGEERLGQLLNIDVNFLHRSLMDFLLTADAQNILQQCTDGPFHARHFLCSAMLIKVSAISAKCWEQWHRNGSQDHVLVKLLSEETDRLLRAVSCSRDLDFALLDVIMSQLKPTFEFLCNSRSQSVGIHGGYMITEVLNLPDFTENWPVRFRVVIEYNIIKLVEAQLTKGTMREDEVTHFLHYALTRHRSRNLCPEMVSHILEAGANPNMIEEKHLSIWWRFLEELVVHNSLPRPNPVSPASVQIMELMIKHKADTDCLNVHQNFWGPGSPPDVHLPEKILLTEILERLDLESAELNRLKSLIHDVEEARTLDPRDAFFDDLKPRKRKQTEGQGSERRKRREMS